MLACSVATAQNYPSTANSMLILFRYWDSQQQKASVSTVAGNGDLSNQNGNGASASFNFPSDVALSPDESFLVVADSRNHVIRRINKGAQGWSSNDVTVTTIAGNGQPGLADGSATTAQFQKPLGVDISPDGTWVAVADSANNRIRKVTLATGNVETIAGFTQGYQDGVGTLSKFWLPASVSFHPQGTGLAVADTNNNRIRWISLPSYSVTTKSGPTVAKSVCSLGFYQPKGACTQTGQVCSCSLVVSSSSNCQTVQYNTTICPRGSPTPSCSGTGVTCTCLAPNTGALCQTDADCTNEGRCLGIAGYANGLGKTAAYNSPQYVRVSPDGVWIYIADGQNNVIRRARVDNGDVDLYGGLPSVAGATDGVNSTDNTIYSAKLGIPVGIAIPSSNDWVYVADSQWDRVRRVGPTPFPNIASITGVLACKGGKYIVNGICYTSSPCLCNASQPDAAKAPYCADGSSPKFVQPDSAPCSCTAPNTNRLCFDTSVCTGSGACESQGTGYKDGAAESAQFNQMSGMAMTGKGDLLFIADYQNHRIRLVNCGGSCSSTTIVLNNSILITGPQGGANERRSPPATLLGMILVSVEMLVVARFFDVR